MLCEISALACNPDNRNKLRQAGACSFAVDAVVRFPYQGIRAVINLALEDESCKTLLRESGACQKIVDAMMRTPYDGLRAIVDLTCDPDNRKKLRGAGGSTWIVQLMMLFKTERGVQLQGLQAIINLAFDGDLDADLKGGDACLWVVEVMTVFYMDRDIQALACTALASLALISVDNQKSMSDADAGSKVVVAMIESFPRDAQVQENGCLAIMAMVRDLNVHKFTIKPFAGVQAIILAMHTFPHDCNIQGNGCGAISSLPKEAIDLNPHELYDACASLVTAMTTFRQDRRIQGNGCLALSKIVVRIAALASNHDLFIDDACSFEQRLLQVTMDAIKAFPDDLGVQKKAWWTMTVMTESCAMTSELQKKECETLVKNAREAWDQQKEEEVDVFVFTNIVMVNIGLEH